MKGICFTRRNCGLFAAITLAAGLLTVWPQVGLAQLFRRCDPCVPCPTTPSTSPAQPGTAAQPGTEAQPGTGTQPGAAAPAPGTEGTTEPTPPENLLAQQDVGAAGGAASAAPTMIGDFLGANGMVLTLANSPTETSVVAPPGSAMPRFKLAENTCPMPADRAYFDYEYYHDVQFTPTSDVSSFTPGFEKTFLGGMMSFEMRLPMANTLDSSVFLDGTTSTNVGEIGDLGMALKCLLIQWDSLYVSGGLAMTVPTAKDTQCFLDHFETSPDLVIRDQSVHLMPFVGALWVPNDRLFVIGSLQVDIDANGDQVDAVTGFAPGLANVGRYRDATMMYVDATAGYWAFRNREHRLLTGLAGVFEVHVNQSLNSASTIQYESVSGTNTMAGQSTISVVDMTLGTHAVIGKRTTLTTGYCLPLTNQRGFDGEFRCLLNYWF